ncbi:hypothetical protein [Planomonospora algeriensis]
MDSAVGVETGSRPARTAAAWARRPVGESRASLRAAGTATATRPSEPAATW